MRTTKLWELFGKNLAWTGTLQAKEAANWNNESDWTPAGRKVMESPRISALHPPRWSTARRAASCWGGGTQSQRNVIGNRNILDDYIGNIGNNDHWMLYCPSKK